LRGFRRLFLALCGVDPVNNSGVQPLFRIRPSGCDAVDFFAFYFRKTSEGAVEGRFHLFYQFM
jgi:hypothetical protein